MLTDFDLLLRWKLCDGEIVFTKSLSHEITTPGTRLIALIYNFRKQKFNYRNMCIKSEEIGVLKWQVKTENNENSDS